MARRKRNNKPLDGRDKPMREYSPQELATSKKAKANWKNRENRLKQIIAMNSRISAWMRENAGNAWVATAVLNEMGVRLGTISAHVMGKRPMSLMNAYRVAQFMNIPLEKVVEEYLYAKLMWEQTEEGAKRKKHRLIDEEFRDIRDITPRKEPEDGQDKE